jgi:very-short-patch-repair endonuclease
MAAALWGGEEALVSHRAAGVLWALDGVTGRRVEITVGREFDRRSPLVIVHRSLHPDPDRRELHGIPITSPARTLIDLARALSPHRLELAVEDAFRRQLTTPEELDRELWPIGGRGRTGCGVLRELLESRGTTTESPWETRVRRLLLDHGLPAPVAQHPVTVAGRTFRLDLAYPEHRVDVEFDSLRWHTGRERLEADSERRNLLNTAGWRIVHVTAGMLREHPEHVVKLVRDALRVDVNREMYGSRPHGR